MSQSDHDHPKSSPKISPDDVETGSYVEQEQIPVGALPKPPTDKHHGLHRGLSARQVSMIAIAGTIGTGLFLGTGRSLAQGGPASMLLCYAIVGFIVYITLLLLGEMATQYPVAGTCKLLLQKRKVPHWCVGSFNAYATRFFSPSYGFALSWNYWFNDAVSVASDLTAAQLVLQFWTPWHSWVISLLFWVFLVAVNSTHVRAYGELGTQFLNNFRCCLLDVPPRILAIVLESRHNRGVYHHWDSRQCWSEQRPPIYWRTLLAYTRGTFCGRFWWVC